MARPKRVWMPGFNVEHVRKEASEKYNPFGLNVVDIQLDTKRKPSGTAKGKGYAGMYKVFLR